MRPTLHDIARETGVSHMTVSRALRGNGRIDPRTQTRIVAMAQKLGYRPNSAAQSVASGRFNCVTLLLGTVLGHSHLPEHLLFGIHDALLAAGMQLKLARLPDSALADRVHLPAVLTEWSCDGLLVDYTHDVPPAMNDAIEASGLPAVWLNTLRETDCVRPDDEAMGRLATQHLLTLGHRRIHYLDCSHPVRGLDRAHYSARDREMGYRAAMRAAGLAPRVFRPRHNVETEARIAAARELLAAEPTAIVAYSVPMELERLLAERGMHIPEDLSIVTFGESRGHVQGRHGDYVRVPIIEVARSAVDLLLRKLVCPSVPLPAALVPSPAVVVGDTTRAVAPPPRPTRRRNP